MLMASAIIIPNTNTISSHPKTLSSQNANNKAFIIEFKDKPRSQNIFDSNATTKKFTKLKKCLMGFSSSKSSCPFRFSQRKHEKKGNTYSLLFDSRKVEREKKTTVSIQVTGTTCCCRCPIRLKRLWFVWWMFSVCQNMYIKFGLLSKVRKKSTAERRGRK